MLTHKKITGANAGGPRQLPKTTLAPGGLQDTLLQVSLSSKSDKPVQIHTQFQ